MIEIRRYLGCALSTFLRPHLIFVAGFTLFVKRQEKIQFFSVWEQVIIQIDIRLKIETKNNLKVEIPS